jgi:DNA-binding NarL/FixJ family response regulator
MTGSQITDKVDVSVLNNKKLLTGNIYTMSGKTKIMIVEDHDLFRLALKKLISETENLELAGEAENGAIFLKAMQELEVDVVLMDIQMPVMNGIEATEIAMKKWPSLKIIALTMFDDDEYLYSMIERGISGFLLKSTTINEIEKAIQMVSEGHQYFSPRITERLVNRLKGNGGQDTNLTPKEMEVLKLVCSGHTSSEIADKLFLSNRTVEGYRARLLEKTGQPNTIKLLIYALKNKLITGSI